MLPAASTSEFRTDQRGSMFPRYDSWSGGLLLVLLAAALFALCPPGRPCPFLAWVAMVPLFSALQGCGARRGFLFGGIFGWLMWFTSVWWLHAPLRDIVGFSPASAIAFIMGGCVLLGLPYAVAAMLAARWPRRGILGTARDAAIFTVAITWLTPVFQGSMAHTQYKYPVVLQVLEVGGAPLLLFLMLWVNAAIAEVLLQFRQKHSVPWQMIAPTAAIPLLVIGYGTIRLQQFESAMATAPKDRWFTVGAIQPNIPIPVSNDRQPDPGSGSNSLFTAIEQARELATRESELDLLVFPENPATFLFNQDTARRAALGNLIKETGKSVLLNADAFDPTATTNGPPERYNVSLVLDTNRNLVHHYQKIKRVPFVEFIPGEKTFPWLRQWLVKSQRVLPGTNAVVFSMSDRVRVIPLICYEGTISALTRQFIKKGGNIIINQVNDSWFLRTPASEVHLALTLFRSVEYRVPLVRITNSGVGAHIQANGKLVPGSRTELFTKTETAFPLFIPAERSLYAWIGGWWQFAFLLLLVRRGRNR